MARNDLTLFFHQSKYENDNNLQNFIASIEDSVQAESNTQLNSSGRTNTLIKRRSARARYCDKGANSVAFMMFGEKGRGDRLRARNQKKIRHCAGYASPARDTDGP